MSKHLCEHRVKQKPQDALLKKKKKGILNYWEKRSSNENAENKGLKQNIFPVSTEERIKIN